MGKCITGSTLVPNHLKWALGEVARSMHWRICEHFRSLVLEKLPRLQELGPEGVVCATGAGPGEVSHAALPDAGEKMWKKCPCSAA